MSIGVYATALWLMGRHEALGAAADPKKDRAALENEISGAAQRHRRRFKMQPAGPFIPLNHNPSMNPIHLHQIALEAMRTRGLLPAF